MFNEELHLEQPLRWGMVGGGIQQLVTDFLNWSQVHLISMRKEVVSLAAILVYRLKDVMQITKLCLLRRLKEKMVYRLYPLLRPMRLIMKSVKRP